MSSHHSNVCATARPGTRSIRALGLGLLMACAATGAFAVEKAVSVTETVDLAAAPAKTWDTIKDFKGWQAWHPAFASTEIVKGEGNTKGTVRLLTAKDGAKFTEELVSFNAVSRTYRYHIIESPLPISDYVSTLQVKQNKDGSSVVWSSHFKVKDGASDEEIRKVISGVYRAGLDNLASVVK
jgi:mxaD protein